MGQTPERERLSARAPSREFSTGGSSNSSISLGDAPRETVAMWSWLVGTMDPAMLAPVLEPGGRGAGNR
jgi:hypothetical protein